MNKEPDFDFQDNNDYEMLTIYEAIHQIEMSIINLSELRKIQKERMGQPIKLIENHLGFSLNDKEKLNQITSVQIPATLYTIK